MRMKPPGITWWEIALWLMCGAVLGKLIWLYIAVSTHAHV